MNAEIIAVGSELLTPERVDTNSLWLTGELNNLGVEVVCKSIVGDDRDRLASAIRQALSRSSILILSGGLGPTEDDVTREAVAQALDRKLVFHSEIADVIAHRFAQMKRTMHEINKRQAFVIEGADVLPNDRGTAPGQWVEDSGGVAMLLPGPPHELKAMFERQCLPRLNRIVPPQVIKTVLLRATGISESELDALISPVYKKYTNLATTILAANGDLQVHLRARCGSEAEADQLLAEVAGPIAIILADKIYSHTGDSLEAVVGNLLRASHSTIAVAESCTGGMLGERFTAIPGSSEYFAGGFITYSNDLKISLLGVPPETIEQHGAVSRETAEAMANGARRRANSTYAISITGIAGPDGGTEEKPVGTVWVGIAGPEGTFAMARRFLGDRARIRVFSTQMALDLLRRKLEKRL
ncbi:MAG TPA: competence/damage-inducible protein A [Bryobacteraceae bacterium]|nr:competence/damage-inducible protein A [Bryobacteraceae bacterium]